MHFCNQCGRELAHREKFCKHCGTRIEYLCALPPFPPGPEKRRPIRKPSAVGKWFLIYLLSTAAIFVLSYMYYSAAFGGVLDLHAWTVKKTEPAAVPTDQASVQNSPPPNTTTVLKTAYNQLTIAQQKANGIYDDSLKVNVPGDPKRTADNYRTILRNADALLVQITAQPGSPAEITAVAVPLKESLSLLGKSTSTMADYLDGKLSLSPPNPDWVARAQEDAAQGRSRLKEAQQALTALRKKIE